ncbi:hypothetical protein N9N67_02320 [Bacteriovoracaceae bacterium]|nr:hypothetical protein [Bacteriovoracaceae bacterium]
MKLYNIILISSIFFSIHLHAGDKSHGGDAYVCFQDIQTADQVNKKLKEHINPFTEKVLAKITSAKLLDLVELNKHNLYKFKNLKKYSLKDAREKVYHRIINRLYFIDGKYAELIDQAPISYRTYGSLPDIADERIKFNRKEHCAFVQIAIQDIDTGDVDRFEKIYDRLNPVHQVALDIHEKLLNYHIKQGEEDSFNVRKLVGYLFSKEFSSLKIYSKAKDQEIEDLKILTKKKFKKYLNF